MNALDFSLLLPDVIVADGRDAQVAKTMGSYVKLTKAEGNQANGAA